MQAFTIPASLLHRQDDLPTLLAALVPYDDGNFEAAHILLEPIARSGNVLAIYKLANSLDSLGHDELAEHFWRIAISAGHAAAANNLANRLKDANRGEEARELYLFAATSGEADGMFNLGVFLEHEDSLASNQWLEKAVEAGHAKACALTALRHFKQGLTDIAFSYARMGIDRNDGYSALVIAMHYKDKDDWAKVLEFSNLALSLDDPIRSHWLKHALAFRALALISLDSFEEAKSAVRECIDAEVDSETIESLELFLADKSLLRESENICRQCSAAGQFSKFCTSCGSSMQ